MLTPLLRSLTAPACALALLGLFADSPAAAEALWEQPFHPDTAALARAADAVPAQEGEPVVNLLIDMSYRYDDAGRETRVLRHVYRIATAKAHESWSTVEQPWAPWHQARPEIRARVITPDGQAHPLDPGVITENGVGRDSPDMFQDGRILRAPLPAIGPGAVVEEEVTVRETTPLFNGGVARSFFPSQSVHCLRFRLSLDVPAAMPLAWKIHLLPRQEPRDETAGGRRRVTFDFTDLPATPKPEPGLPSDVPRYASIAFSTGTSWQDVARRYSEAVDAAIHGSDVSPLTTVAAGAPRDEAIARVLAKMAAVRYTGVELGKGSILPRPPAETLKSLFGDCKDKAVLLVAALRALDIPASVALLSAGEDTADVEPSLPGFGRFNHAIVAIPGPSGSPTLWIDPTDPYARMGELPVMDQGRLSLIASPTAAGLTRLPEATTAGNHKTETREIFLAEMGPARVVETTEYRGTTERQMRALFASKPREELRRMYAGHAETVYLAKELSSFEISPPDQLTQPLRVKLEMQQAGRGITDVAEAAVALMPAALLLPLPAELGTEPDKKEPPKRIHDYVIPKPFSVELRLRVVPPSGFKARELPPAQERALGTASLSQQYSIAPNGEVTALWKLDSGKRRLSPQELGDLRKAFLELGKSQPVLITFEHTGEALLKAGHIREALAELRTQAQAPPGRALPHTRLARALLNGGLGEAAREEAETAVKLEPGSALAHRTLAWVLQHDALGRRFGPGFDRSQAIAAYRKAKELDPQDAIARADLAILLEHDAQGHRYAPGGDLPLAIAEYQSLRQDIKKATGMDDNLLVALMRAGRFAEMKKLADELDPTEHRRPLRLAALAALDGADAALRDAERTWSEPDKRLQGLTEAASNLIMARRYSEAAALMSRASQLSPDAASLLVSADVLQRARRHEGLKPETGTPDALFRRFLLAMGKDARTDDLRALFTHRLGKSLATSGPEPVNEIFKAFSEEAEKAGMPADVVLDLALAGMLTTLSGGNDLTGYRLEATDTSGNSSAHLVLYMVKEDGDYRIASVANDPSALGEEALEWLDHGDLSTARQWLGWAQDDKEEEVSDDPLLGSPFTTLWKKGEESAAPAVRCAAAALAAEGDEESPRALLEACRKDAASPTQQLALDLALARLFRTLGRDAEMLAAAQRVQAARPDSAAAFDLVAQALNRLARWEDLRRAAGERLARRPDDASARKALARVAEAAGDLAKVESTLLPLAGAAKAEPMVLNNLAWNALLQGRADERTLDWARRAAASSEYKKPEILHTLAAVYAEQGKTAEARQILLQSLTVRSDPAPTADDWYVLGRLAEHYGLPKEARRLYERVVPPKGKPKGKGDDRLSCQALAKARLAHL
jgi:tetratricopeptide (TPR) repeat protein